MRVIHNLNVLKKNKNIIQKILPYHNNLFYKLVNNIKKKFNNISSLIIKSSFLAFPLL